jgi:dUTP pyrophosphatase
MEVIKTKFKRLRPEAILPSYAHKGDAGMDFYSCADYKINPGERVLIPTGWAIELPEGFVSLIWDKSGIAIKKGLTVLGGVIEHNYRGEYGVILFNTSNEIHEIKKGEKVAQLLIQPICNAITEEVLELSETSRGEGGFGSTGIR